MLRELVQGVEALGFHSFAMSEHLLGMSPTAYPNIDSRGHITSKLHEPLTTFAYLAAVTQSITLMTSMLILPLRQTAVVAKQAAAVDYLSGGRLRLGVTISWNQLEYESMGVDFATRGQRLEEQVQVLRCLWTQETVHFEGKWHTLKHAGINPRPVQQPIPIWFGAGQLGPVIHAPTARVIRRIGRFADGWAVLSGTPQSEVLSTVASIRAAAEEAGRNPDAFGFQVSLAASPNDANACLDELRSWQEHGVTEVRLTVIPQESLTTAFSTLAHFKEIVQDAGLWQE